MPVTTINEKDAVILKESKDGCTGGFGGREGKGEIV